MISSSPDIKRIGLLGASFDTGNLGVNALAESSLKCILHRWPDATVDLLASGRADQTFHLVIGGNDVQVDNLPIRFCKNIFMRNHYIILFLTAVFLRIFRFNCVKEFCAKRNPYLLRILEIDLVADITGGDSFSDIYGVRRFFQGALTKYLWLLFGKEFVFLPQTYGPFNRGWVKWVAKGLLKRAFRIYSRDSQGYDRVSSLLSADAEKMKKVSVVPDVAFVLDPLMVEDAFSQSLLQHRRDQKTIIGLNVSGLLYNGGYTGDNMFSLGVDYHTLVQSIIQSFLSDEHAIVVLVPHVCPRHGYAVESDPIACSKIYEQFESSDGQDRILVAGGDYDHRQIKYIISLCDFFMGARMHSCIAALSQSVPTVGLAYSDKFSGVFDTVGQLDHVADLRSMDEAGILSVIRQAYDQRDSIRRHLASIIEETKTRILTSLF